MQTKSDSGHIATTQIYIEDAKKTILSSVDLFFFNDDALRRLDSYQRFDSSDLSILYASSRKGRKIAVAIANLPETQYTWNEINSYDALCQKYALFENEDPLHPAMAGECTVQAGAESRCSLSLTPLLSEISIHSICCDFHGKPYEGKRLENVQVYLINLSGAHKILCTTPEAPSIWLNCGRMDPADMNRMQHSGMAFARLEESIGDETLFPDLKLYCYPNEIEAETMGHPCTRIVIEGEMDGRTYYYPVNINCPGFGYSSGVQGISRNTSYSIDISITLLGTDDPDTPAASGAVDVFAKVAGWKEKGEIKIGF